MISDEIKIKEAINELKQIFRPARPCLLKICAETHSIEATVVSDSSLWRKNLPVFLLHVKNMLILRLALFTDNFTNLHYNTIQRGHEAIAIFARNCLAFLFNFIVMQM